MERKNAWEKYDESGKKDVFEFSEKFLFFRFFLIFCGQQKLYLLFCPHLVWFIIVITNPYVPYRSV